MSSSDLAPSDSAPDLAVFVGLVKGPGSVTVIGAFSFFGVTLPRESPCSGRPCPNLTIERGGPTPSQGFFLRHMKNVEVSHAEVQPVAADPRASFYLEDLHRADFVAVTAPSTPPAFSINNSSDVRIRISRAAPDSTP